ncbi:MAG: hypothetical protein QW609_02245 [Candidatus Aenigmatarchaeota archaeon]
MGFCIWGLSWLSCGIIGLFKWLLSFFLPEIPDPIYFFVSLAISSVMVYILGALLGRIGGIILSIIGILGTAVTAGTSLIITIIGLLLVFFGKPKLLILLNLILYVLCAACYGIG